MSSEHQRRLVAVLACRADSSRLFGKPLQHVAPERTILRQIVEGLQTFSIIDEIVLGISDGVANLIFIDVATSLGVPHVVGDPKDVLSRLIAGGRLVGATDVFRVTTEDPFFDYSMLEPAWERHVASGRDITVLDYVPEGTAFEIYTIAALERIHRESDEVENFSVYPRSHQSLFALEILQPAPECARLDLRLTIDNAEDLIVCQQVFGEFAALAPRVPLDKIIAFLDQRPDLTSLVAHLAPGVPTWARHPQRVDDVDRQAIRSA
jgi:spore coat polysaccharide biosynthesis protein SpsF